MIVFDIETGPLARAEIEPLCPEFEAPSNYANPDKIAAYVEAKREEWFSRAALSALTGRVLAIGYQAGDGFGCFATGDEGEDIAGFWDLMTDNGAITNRIVGFNILGFDIPFLVRRSWKLGIPVPYSLFRGRWANEALIDLMDVWKCGCRDQSVSLRALARFLGVGDKTGQGKDFADLLERDREAALAYLENDVRLTARCAAALGIW